MTDRDELAVVLLEHRQIDEYRARNRSTGERAGVIECHCGLVTPDHAEHVAEALFLAGYRKVDLTATPRTEWASQYDGQIDVWPTEGTARRITKDMRDAGILARVVSRTVTVTAWEPR